MTEYIEREAAIKAVCEGCNAEYGEEPCEPSDCTIMQTLRSIPAADVREVVLCRDCKYWFNAPVADGFNSCELDALIRHENFFCAAGERKTNCGAKMEES